MATRRPKVPRVTPASRHPETGSAGGDVIQADFGAHRPADAVTEAGTRLSWQSPKTGRLISGSGCRWVGTGVSTAWQPFIRSSAWDCATHGGSVVC